MIQRLNNSKQNEFNQKIKFTCRLPRLSFTYLKILKFGTFHGITESVN